MIPSLFEHMAGEIGKITRLGSRIYTGENIKTWQKSFLKNTGASLMNYKRKKPDKGGRKTNFCLFERKALIHENLPNTTIKLIYSENQPRQI